MGQDVNSEHKNQNGGNFAGGFVVGVFLGSLLGGILGATVAYRYKNGTETIEPDNSSTSDHANSHGEGKELNSTEQRKRRRSLREQAADDRIEATRRSLEGKIAQLNHAIDDVRQQLEAKHANESLNQPNVRKREDS